MATPNFPAYARILTEGYGEAPDYGMLRSDMDGGLAKQRPRRTKPIVTRTVRVMVRSTAERLAFDTFHRVSLFGGSAWFTFVDPVDAVSKQGRLVGGSIGWSKMGPLWFFNSSIETVG
ncbi:hypothetical protein [Schauerella aestuarii]|uniref:hypothetical protein n=1 Tax=Schauerella aestuarii TaxID=2511204 RepID=UPI00136DB9B2|nr:hypothetical protein [Achromobacter aestuarii]MYZ44220.1 hypothetical protein [Achromobacter aestuarii]